MNSQKMDTQTCRLLLIENKADLDIKDVSIRDVLNSLMWDGMPRIRSCLHHFLGADESDYLELSRRGGKVNIGKYGSTEVDFVTQKEGVLTYYQVTADMTAEETFEREMRPLRSIQDNYEKIVLTLDRFSLGNYDGIKVMNCQHHGKALPPTHRPENTAAERRHNCF